MVCENMDILQFVRGFCMALADSVPGVSGGTVAFLLGFYEEFIGAIDDLVSGDRKKKKEAFLFLLKLGIGWIIAFLLAMLVIANVFETHIYQISSLFLGFIVFALPIVVNEEKECLSKHKTSSIYILIGIVIVVAITYFNPIAGQESSVNVEHLTLGLAFYLLLAGAIAISAMVLPGISGSTLLLVMGLYMPIVDAIKEILTLQLQYIPSVFVLGCGMLVGIVFVVKLIKKALEKYRSQTIYLILGLMIGSLYSIVMGPTTLEEPRAAMTIHEFYVVFFLLGGVILWGMQKLKTCLENKKEGIQKSIRESLK